MGQHSATPVTGQWRQAAVVHQEVYTVSVALSRGQVQSCPPIIVPEEMISSIQYLKTYIHINASLYSYLAPMSLPPPCRRLRAVTSPVVAEYIREVVVC